MIGVIYARYSSDSQREESIEGQIRECKEFAAKNDIKIVDTYIDRAMSAKPMLTKEQIVFWLHKLRELNINRLEHRRRLIDSFVNAIFLYDDRMVITFNFKDGTKKVTYRDLETSGLYGSDFTDFGVPEKTDKFRQKLVGFSMISVPYGTGDIPSV